MARYYIEWRSADNVPHPAYEEAESRQLAVEACEKRLRAQGVRPRILRCERVLDRSVDEIIADRMQYDRDSGRNLA